MSRGTFTRRFSQRWTHCAKEIPLGLWSSPARAAESVSSSTGARAANFPSSTHLPILNGGTSGGAAPLLFFDQAKPQVATIVLRYQDGESEHLTPTEGFVLHEITPAHYKRGARLVAALALDRSGHPIYTQRFRPQEWGVYPCKKPVDRGYGVKTCP